MNQEYISALLHNFLILNSKFVNIVYKLGQNPENGLFGIPVIEQSTNTTDLTVLDLM